MDQNDGFTLVEMLVVVSLLAILTGFGISGLIGYRNNQQVNQAAREIYGALQSAKIYAIRDNRTINVIFIPGAVEFNYHIYEDVNGDEVFSRGTDNELGSGFLPPGVTMEKIGFAGSSSDNTAFSPMGLTTGRNGTVTVTNGHRTASVVVNSVGGIRIE